MKVGPAFSAFVGTKLQDILWREGHRGQGGCFFRSAPYRRKGM